MGQESSKTTSQDTDWNRALVFAWLAGALSLQVPFQRIYKFGAGNLGYNLLMGTGAIAIGILLLVGLTHLCRRLIAHCPQESSLRKLTIRSFAAATVLFLVALIPVVPLAVYWAGLAALAFWLMAAGRSTFAAISQHGVKQLRTAFAPKGERKAWQFNGAFWLLVLFVLLARDFMALGEIKEKVGWETILIILGRLLSLGAFTMAAILISQALLNFFPAYTRWLVIAGAVLIPLIAVADFAAGLYWQQPLVDIVNNLTLDGKFDMKIELDAAGIKQSPLQVSLAVIGIIALAIAAYFGLQKVSRSFELRLRTSRAFLIFGCLWIGAIAQQGLSMVSVRKEIWQAEHATFTIHLGLLRPDPGLQTLDVIFVETQSESDSKALLNSTLPTLERRPDIYIVMVETWRSDTVRPEVMPFLSKFVVEECQQFETTFAGSNCTPVSWYTFFHSRIGIDWRDELAKGKQPGGFEGAYPIRLLSKLGYQCSVRAVCDLSYKQMCDLNFGANHKFAQEFLDAPLIPGDLGVPNREVVIVDDLKKQLSNTPKGGHLHYIALDSAHYNYYWPNEDFTPVHQDCAEIDFGALKPTREQIREVVKRYENSVNWIDKQMEELITHLKAEGRYENSIIILTGDHGEEFQENGAWFHCSSLRREQTEVPIMIRWPDWVTTQPAQKQVSHLDVMPSVLDALGLEERFFKKLAGHSTLREHPGETFLSTRWPGKSDIGVCLVKDGVKANFKAHRLWLDGLPKKLYFIGYADLNDQPLDPLTIRGDRNSYLQDLQSRYPDSIGRNFSKFEAAK